MSATAGKTTTGKVWHVAVWAGYVGQWRPLCARGRQSKRLGALTDLATVPAYRLCQHCERASEQIAAAIARVQS